MSVTIVRKIVAPEALSKKVVGEVPLRPKGNNLCDCPIGHSSITGETVIFHNSDCSLGVKKKSVKKATKKSMMKKAMKKVAKKTAPKKVVKKAVKKKAVKKEATKRSLKYKTPKSLQGRQGSDRGKDFERKVVKFFKPLHAVRVGGMGDNNLRKSFDVYMSDQSSIPVDTVQPTVCVECKSRKKLSFKEADRFLEKLERRFSGNSEPPVTFLCVKEVGKNGFFVVFRNDTAKNTLTLVHSSCIGLGEECGIGDFLS